MIVQISLKQWPKEYTVIINADRPVCNEIMKVLEKYAKSKGKGTVSGADLMEVL